MKARALGIIGIAIVVLALVAYGGFEAGVESARSKTPKT